MEQPFRSLQRSDVCEAARVLLRAHDVLQDQVDDRRLVRETELLVDRRGDSAGAAGGSCRRRGSSRRQLTDSSAALDDHCRRSAQRTRLPNCMLKLMLKLICMLRLLSRRLNLLVLIQQAFVFLDVIDKFTGEIVGMLVQLAGAGRRRVVDGRFDV